MSYLCIKLQLYGLASTLYLYLARHIKVVTWQKITYPHLIGYRFLIYFYSSIYLFIYLKKHK